MGTACKDRLCVDLISLSDLPWTTVGTDGKDSLLVVCAMDIQLTEEGCVEQVSL